MPFRRGSSRQCAPSKPPPLPKTTINSTPSSSATSPTSPSIAPAHSIVRWNYGFSSPNAWGALQQNPPLASIALAKEDRFLIHRLSKFRVQRFQVQRLAVPPHLA